MTDDDDYERLEDEIDDFDIYTLNEYGDHYKNLSDEKKEKVIIDRWFTGHHQQQNMYFSGSGYQESARQLRIGLDYYQNNRKEMKNITVKTFMRKGKEYTFVMQNGKFKSKVKE